MNAKFARFIRGRCHDAAFARPTDGDRFAPQFRIIALFNRRIKSVHVDMDHLSAGIGRDNVV